MENQISYRISLYTKDHRYELGERFRTRAAAAPAMRDLCRKLSVDSANCILSLERGERCIEGHRFYRSEDREESRAVDRVFRNLLMCSDRQKLAESKIPKAPSPVSREERATSAPRPVKRSAQLGQTPGRFSKCLHFTCGLFPLKKRG